MGGMGGGGGEEDGKGYFGKLKSPWNF